MEWKWSNEAEENPDFCESLSAEPLIMIFLDPPEKIYAASFSLVPSILIAFLGLMASPWFIILRQWWYQPPSTLRNARLYFISIVCICAQGAF